MKKYGLAVVAWLVALVALYLIGRNMLNSVDSVERSPVRRATSIDSTNVPVSSTGEKNLAESPEFGRLQNVPREITHNPTIPYARHTLLASIAGEISNATFKVSEILGTGDYQVHEFSRSIWLTHEDEEDSCVWTIYPHGTNAVVGSVVATKYEDASWRKKDPRRSFSMRLNPTDGTLESFSWADNHEVFLKSSESTIDYARDMGGEMGLVMRWNSNGSIISSNIYNWAKRGKVIGNQ